MTLAADLERPSPSTTVDLDAYFARIGYAGSREPNLATLSAIVDHHARHIPFENLNPFTGRGVELDVGSLQEKLVFDGGGGYCFEHNLLLKHVLDSLGFTTTGLAARVRWNQPDDAPLGARSHMLLRVDLDEGPHLVDVGFGAMTLTGALRLEVGIVQDTPHEQFRLVGAGDEFELQALTGETWRTLYRFGLTEYIQADYEVSSWYLSNHPESHFVTGLIAAATGTDRRITLSGTTLNTYHLDGRSESRTLESVAELRTVLEEEFGIDRSRLEGLDDELARLF